MALSRNAWRWTALTGLWTVVGLILWLMAIQIFLILVTPFGTWQKPGISQVTVKWIDRDPQSTFTDNVIVDHEGEERSLCMLKAERAGLTIGEAVWILDNYYVTTTRPAQFRLTPWRLVLEYPAPLLILCLFGIWRIRRRMAREVKEDPNRPRTVFRDEFHARAQRFAAPKEAEKD
jgi:hypothetical protein